MSDVAIRTALGARGRRTAASNSRRMGGRPRWIRPSIVWRWPIYRTVSRGARHGRLLRVLVPPRHDGLKPCTPDDPLAGLVGTQNIRNNQSRVGGLDYIVQDGTVIEAVVAPGIPPTYGNPARLVTDDCIRAD